LCIWAAQADAQRKYPLDAWEHPVMDEYLRGRVEVRKASGSYTEHRIEAIESLFMVQ
jgi:hypothetical protein